jgi:hypothetical protein
LTGVGPPRAGLIAGIFTVNYLVFGIPALIAGVAVTYCGLHQTTLVYLGVIAVLAAGAASSMLVRRHSARTMKITPTTATPSASGAGPDARARPRPI